VSLDTVEVNRVPDLTARVVRAVSPKGSMAVRLRGVLGPVFEDADFASAFSHTGRPAVAPGRLALVCVLQYAENLTDRAAAEAVRFRLDWKYLLGLELEDPGFHFSVLSEFRSRLVAAGLESRILEAVLERCHGAGLLGAGGEVRVDSTRILSVARELNRMEYVGQTLRAALEALAAAAPEWLAAQLTVEQVERYETPIDAWRLPEGTDARQRWAQTVGGDGFALIEAVGAAEGLLDWLGRVPAVAHLAEVWGQQYLLDERGRAVWREGKQLPPGRKRGATPYDPEARWATKRGSDWTGWKIHVAETCGDAQRPNLICQVITTDAATGDVEVTAEIVAGSTDAARLYADMGYASIAHVNAAAADGIELVSPLRGSVADASLFTHADFTIEWDRRTVVCPTGRSSTVWSDTKTTTGKPVVKVLWDREGCLACPLRERCSKSTMARYGRGLSLRPREEYEAMTRLRDEQRSEAWKQRYKRRAGIEGTINQIVHRTGIRRSRYRGKDKTHLGHCFAAAAINLYRIDAWSCGYKPSETRTSHLSHIKQHIPA
jgi:transposase